MARSFQLWPNKHQLRLNHRLQLLQKQTEIFQIKSLLKIILPLISEHQNLYLQVFLRMDYQMGLRFLIQLEMLDHFLFHLSQQLSILMVMYWFPLRNHWANQHLMPWFLKPSQLMAQALHTSQALLWLWQDPGSHLPKLAQPQQLPAFLTEITS